MEKSLVAITGQEKYITTSGVRQYVSEAKATLCTGSCVMIDKKKYILTCGHCLLNFSIYLHNPLVPTRYKGTVEFVSKEMDLMLLSSQLTDHLTPIELDLLNMPFGKSVIKWSCQREDHGAITTTKGIVRALSRTFIGIGIVQVLLYEIDMRTIPGDSGSPILKDDKIIAIASASDNYNDQPSYCVTGMMIKTFIDNFLRYKSKGDLLLGFPKLPILYQNSIENKPALKKMLNYQKNYGIYVTKSGDDNIKTGDVLLEINNISINSDGNVLISDIWKEAKYKIPIPLIDYVNFLPPNSPASLKIFRDDKFIDIKLDPSKYVRKTIRSITAHKYLEFTWCGLTFTPLTYEFLHEAETYDFPIQSLLPSIRLFINVYEFTQRSCILITSCMLHDDLDLNMVSYTIVDTVNNIAPTELDHLHGLLSSGDFKYITIKLFSTDNILVFDRDTVKKIPTSYFSPLVENSLYIPKILKK